MMTASGSGGGVGRVLFLLLVLLPAGQAEPADQLSTVRAALPLEKGVK